MKVGSVLKKYRRMNRLKMKDIAERMKISAPLYRAIENDRRDIKLSEIIAIAKMYGIAPHVLIFQMMTIDDVAREKRKTFELMQPTIASIADAFNDY